MSSDSTIEVGQIYKIAADEAFKIVLTMKLKT